jgi:hypothetical protein
MTSLACTFPHPLYVAWLKLVVTNKVDLSHEIKNINELYLYS